MSTHNIPINIRSFNQEQSVEPAQHVVTAVPKKTFLTGVSEFFYDYGWWIMVMVIVLIVVGGVAYYYRDKWYSTSKKTELPPPSKQPQYHKPPSQPPQQPQQPQSQPLLKPVIIQPQVQPEPVVDNESRVTEVVDEPAQPNVAAETAE